MLGYNPSDFLLQGGRLLAKREGRNHHAPIVGDRVQAGHDPVKVLRELVGLEFANVVLLDLDGRGLSGMMMQREGRRGREKQGELRSPPLVGV